ncbi:CENP-B protein, partial [Dendrothele bispora CBS 962.96]
GKATVHQDGNRELITVVDCICADGTVLPPFIVMKGARPSFAWAKDSLLEKAFFAASPNGWIDGELFLEWLERCYKPATREKAGQEWRALIFDQHESHLSYPVIKFALEHKIICIGLPPKTSGITQPLDVLCFRPLQQAYGRAVDEETRGAVAIAKQDFPRILPRAREQAFTRTNIVAGFERTGIYP